MRRVILDALQLAGLGLIAAGAAVSFGLGAALMVAGGLLIVVPLVEAQLFRRG